MKTKYFHDCNHFDNLQILFLLLCSFLKKFKDLEPWHTTCTAQFRNASAPELVCWCTAEYQVLTTPKSQTSRQKRRRTSVAGQSFFAAHVTKQNMSWSLALSCCIVGNLAEFSSSCAVWHSSHNSCCYLHFCRFQQNLASKAGQYEKKVWNIYRYI